MPNVGSDTIMANTPKEAVATCIKKMGYKADIMEGQKEGTAYARVSLLDGTKSSISYYTLMNMHKMERKSASKKCKDNAFGKDVYYIGTKDGETYWLSSPVWECGWYWSFGNICTYTNKKKPSLAKDIRMSTHFSYLFMNGKEDVHSTFVKFFDSTPFTDKEIWQFCELMRSFYVCREFADMTSRGGTYLTENPCKEILKDNDLYTKVNQVMLPEIFKGVQRIVEP
jgi:hypothetical protein